VAILGALKVHAGQCEGQDRDQLLAKIEEARLQKLEWRAQHKPLA